MASSRVRQTPTRLASESHSLEMHAGQDPQEIDVLPTCLSCGTPFRRCDAFPQKLVLVSRPHPGDSAAFPAGNSSAFRLFVRVSVPLWLHARVCSLLLQRPVLVAGPLVSKPAGNRADDEPKKRCEYRKRSCCDCICCIICHRAPFLSC